MDGLINDALDRRDAAESSVRILRGTFENIAEAIESAVLFADDRDDILQRAIVRLRSIHSALPADGHVNVDDLLVALDNSCRTWHGQPLRSDVVGSDVAS